MNIIIQRETVSLYHNFQFGDIYIYIYIYIYTYTVYKYNHPRRDCFIVSQLSVWLYP